MITFCWLFAFSLNSTIRSTKKSIFHLIHKTFSARSDMFGQPGIVFLSANNSVVVAHKGSSASLSCRLTKGPSFGMVSEKPFGGNLIALHKKNFLTFFTCCWKQSCKTLLFKFFFTFLHKVYMLLIFSISAQMTWSRRLLPSSVPQVLTIGDSAYIEDPRILVAKKPHDNVRCHSPVGFVLDLKY